MELRPTLWRTCRALSGKTRQRLFRQVIDFPGQSVTDIAKQTGISCSRASQELRRLQSRGLLRSERTGAYVQYIPESDPLVVDAQPILAAMRATFARFSPADDKQSHRIAAALAHPRRIAILKELLNGPRNIHELQTALHIPSRALYRHLTTLQDGKMIGQSHQMFRTAPNAHPLAKCLVDLVKAPEQSKSN